MSAGSSGPMGDSKSLAGTHEGAITNTSSGRPSDASSIHSTPSRPSTLATSCGSVTTAVVPCGTTARANSVGVSFDDSMCTCASMNPGTMYWPRASMRSPPSYSPSPAIRPPNTATSTSSHSRVNTEST